MTETAAPPQGPLPRPPRSLYRDPDNSMFAGVCTAVARYTDTDPVIWRIVTVVLAVFGGAGGVLYLLGWLLIPKIGEDASLAEQWLHRRHRLSPVAIIVIVIAAIVVLGGLDDGNAVAALAVLAAVGYLVHRDREGRPIAPAYAGPAMPRETPAAFTATTAGAGAGAGATAHATPDATTTAETPAWTAPAWPTDPAAWAGPPPEPPLRSRLGPVTLSIAALVGGVLVLARAYGADSLTPARILAAVLLVVGGGLVVGTWLGRARWLALIGVLLAVALAGTAATDDATDTFSGGFGQRNWVVAATAAAPSYRLGIGEATLDLRGLPASGPHVVVQAHIGAGHLIVLVPDDVAVRLHAKVRVGDITEFGDSIANGGDRVDRTRTYGPPGDPRVEVEAAVTAGQVEVRHG